MPDKVLIIDDERSIRFTFVEFLEEAGYEAASVGSFDEAVEYLRDHHVDLAFLDIFLGGRSGIEVLEHIKGRGLGTLVVLITGSPDLETASAAVKLGAYDYIMKPIRLDTLLRVTAKALEHKRLHDERERYRSNLEAIFKSVRDGIITIDKNLIITEINDSVTNICGYTRDIIGKPFKELNSECTGSCMGYLKKIIEAGSVLQPQRVLCKNSMGVERTLSISASPLMMEGAQQNGAVLVIRDESRLAELERGMKDVGQYHRIVGSSQVMQDVYSLIFELVDLDTTVLITGESGTGKELVAEALHYGGVRKSKQLVKVNCSALPDNLLESELFGHVKGAFTGAIRDNKGRFEMADGGTLFLDEIGDISPSMQLKLLRVLQEKEFEPVGSTETRKVDVRVLAATNRDLAEMVRQGRFREDLFYRLNVVEVKMPPLRERTGDIPMLVDQFLTYFYQKLNKSVIRPSQEVMDFFMDHRWPGNVRQLRHAIEHASIRCHGQTITLSDLPPILRESAAPTPLPEKEPEITGPKGERELIMDALESSRWNKARAAKTLGVSRQTLYRKMSSYGIED